MPIITVQRRMAEQGRIRLGQKITGTSKQGKAYTRPAKLDRFRFTSPNQRLIEEVAERYGGTAQAWDNDGKPEFEVVTDATAIPIIVVKGGFSQWHEFWTRGGCQHRCDGEKDPAGNFCNPDDPAHLQAIEKPTTRLSVMLAEIETLGVWRMESKGWNAAAELPSMAELAMHVGDLVPATLSLAQRSAIIEVNGKPQTSRFVVPVLDLHVTKKRLVELVGGVGGAPALEQAAPAGAVAIEAPPTPYPTPGYGQQLMDATTPEECRAIWQAAGEAGHLDDALKGAITARVEQVKAGQIVPEVDPFEQGEQQARVDEPVDAEVVEDDPATEATADGVDPRAPVWQELLLLAGQRGMTQTDLEADVEFMRGKSLHDCQLEDLQAVLEAYRTGEVAEAVTA